MSRLLVLLLLSSLLGWTSSKSNSTTTTNSGAKTYAPPAPLPTGESSSGTTSKIDGLTWIYTSPEQWYSQHDLCIIKNWHKTSNLTLVEVAKTKCHQDVLADEWAGKLSIGYGHSYSATCSPPLTSRPQYMQALVGFNEPNSMHLVEAVRSMRLLVRTTSETLNLSFFLVPMLPSQASSRLYPYPPLPLNPPPPPLSESHARLLRRQRDATKLHRRAGRAEAPGQAHHRGPLGQQAPHGQQGGDVTAIECNKVPVLISTEAQMHRLTA